MFFRYPSPAPGKWSMLEPPKVHVWYLSKRYTRYIRAAAMHIATSKHMQF